MISLKNHIENIFKENGREDLLLKTRISKILIEILGENISSGITVQSFKNGKLYLKSNNSIWAFELSINKEVIKKRLNEVLGKETIKQIISR